MKCLVKATERKMSVWRMETSDDREEKHHWSTLGCHTLKMKPNYMYQVLDDRLIEVTTMGELILGW